MIKKLHFYVDIYIQFPSFQSFFDLKGQVGGERQLGVMNAKMSD